MLQGVDVTQKVCYTSRKRILSTAVIRPQGTCRAVSNFLYVIIDWRFANCILPHQRHCFLRSMRRANRVYPLYQPRKQIREV